MQKVSGLFLLLFYLSPGAAQAALLDAFETDNKWRVATWGDEAKAELTEAAHSEGQKALKVYWLDGFQRKGKGIVLERDIGSLGREFTSLRLDVELPDLAAGQVTMAVETDEYYESQLFNLEKGWNRDVVFYLSSKTWKSKTTGWQHQSAVNRVSAPKKIYLIFYLADLPSGHFHIDHVRLAQEAEPRVTSGPQAEVQPARTKKNHYRPRELPIEIFIHP